MMRRVPNLDTLEFIAQDLGEFVVVTLVVEILESRVQHKLGSQLFLGLG